VMIGRAARGQPWLLAQVAHQVWGGPAPIAPTGAALAALIGGHYDAMLAFYGVGLGGKVARKHLGWYMDHAGTDANLRQMILTADQPAMVHRLLPDAFATPLKVAA
jgi:tRNA-dihydrouridine synthase B